MPQRKAPVRYGTEPLGPQHATSPPSASRRSRSRSPARSVASTTPNQKSSKRSSPAKPVTESPRSPKQAAASPPVKAQPNLLRQPNGRFKRSPRSRTASSSGDKARASSDGATGGMVSSSSKDRSPSRSPTRPLRNRAKVTNPFADAPLVVTKRSRREPERLLPNEEDMKKKLRSPAAQKPAASPQSSSKSSGKRKRVIAAVSTPRSTAAKSNTRSSSSVKRVNSKSTSQRNPSTADKKGRKSIRKVATAVAATSPPDDRVEHFDPDELESVQPQASVKSGSQAEQTNPYNDCVTVPEMFALFRHRVSSIVTEMQKALRIDNAQS